MEIDKEKLIKEFEAKFTYLAGDGRRMYANPKVVQQVIDWIFIQIEKHGNQK